MKNTTTFLCLLVAVLCSCKKNKDVVPAEGKKYNVSFAASNFTSTIEAFKSGAKVSATGNEVKSTSPYLYCRVYINKPFSLDDGRLVGIATQAVTDPNFGKFNFELEGGNYVAMFIATDQRFNPISGLGSSSEGSLPYNQAFFDARNPDQLTTDAISDLFIEKVEFTVSNQPIDYPVVLRRVVAGFQLILEDLSFPTDRYVEVKVARGGLPKVYFAQESFIAADLITRLSSLSTYNALLLNGQRQVTISVFNSQGQELKKKVLTVDFLPNHKTILKGKIFSESVSFNVSIDANWIPTPLVVDF